MGTAVATSFVGPTASFELAANFAAVSPVAPAYVTLMSLGLTTELAASQLFFLFTSTWRHIGPFAGNVALNFRFRLNGVLLTGGVTDNKVRSQIGNAARNRRVAVTAGLQTLNVELAYFGPAGQTILIDPVALPDLNHSALFMQEQL